MTIPSLEIDLEKECSKCVLHDVCRHYHRVARAHNAGKDNIVSMLYQSMFREMMDNVLAEYCFQYTLESE